MTLDYDELAQYSQRMNLNISNTIPGDNGSYDNGFVILQGGDDIICQITNDDFVLSPDIFSDSFESD